MIRCFKCKSHTKLNANGKMVKGKSKKVGVKGAYLVCLNLHPFRYQTADKRIKMFYQCLMYAHIHFKIKCKRHSRH